MPDTAYVLLLVPLILAAATPDAHAWGSRGHAIICETAAYLIGTEKRAFLKSESYHLGYYCNVPDTIWKSTNYKQEHHQHFIDLEIFDKHAPEKEWSNDRQAFFAKHPEIKDEAGRAPWRITEFHTHALELARKLRAFDGQARDRKELQLLWLVTVGTMGHYVGDLAQPLHVTESYDGQKTNQKGVHFYFEIEAIDELGLALSGEVLKRAQAIWAKGPPACDEPFPCSMALARESAKHVKELLELDQKNGRASLPKATKAFHDLIVERLASGAVTLAALWRKSSDFEFDHVKFWSFEPSPPYPPAP